jgi:hypothetical protein
MVRKNGGVVAQIRKEASLFGNKEFLRYRCSILHQENLCAKSVSIKNVIKDIVTIVNFIGSHGLNNR